MSDILRKLHGNRAVAPLARALGLPNPPLLARSSGGYEAQPFAGKTALLVASGGAHASAYVADALIDAGASVVESAPADGNGLDIVVIDATGCTAPLHYEALYLALQPVLRRIAGNGRMLLLAPPPMQALDPVAAAVARGLEGLSRSLGKELGKRGICVNLAYVARDAVDRLSGPLRFFCGKQTTYVSGQAVHITSLATRPAALPWSQALAGKVALVTGAARGIGMATAQRLAQEGARVICLDVPGASEALQQTCARIGATPLPLDIAAPDAPEQLVEFLRREFGGLDILVHNAGITRDRTLAKMELRDWNSVIDINFAAIAAIDSALIGQRVLHDDARIICLSSISAVAGNFGQTNYATSKAALIGYVAAQAPLLAPRGICINAVAPGFIETAMTQKMPFFTREIGSRLNSLLQAGQPRDAAELIAFLCTPGASGISGQTIRVCGQGLIGA